MPLPLPSLSISPTLTPYHPPSSLSLSDPFASPPRGSDNSMPLPPKATYLSAEEAKEAIEKWAAQYNYAFTKLCSKPVNGSQRKEVWACDQSGQPPSSDNQHHTNQACQCCTSSRKTGCKFSVNLVEVNPTCWEVRYHEAQFCTYNHTPSSSQWSHPTHRQLGKEEIDKLRELHSAGM